MKLGVVCRSSMDTKIDEVIEVTSVSFDPEGWCPISERLNLTMDFDAFRKIARGSWRISFIVDSVDARHIVDIGSTPQTDYEEGRCCVHFEGDVDVANIEPSVLANCGLLVASLEERGEEVVKVQMVVEVRQDDDGQLARIIYSPLS